MKKIKLMVTALPLLLLLLVTCQSSYAGNVSEQQANIVAQNFMKAKTRNHSYAILHYQQTEPDGSVNFYIFNFLSQKGFVIVTGDDRIKPIIAYSTEGNFDISVAEKSGVSWWINKMQKQIQAAKKDNIQPDPATAELWNSYLSDTQVVFQRSTTVEPLLTTTWDQGTFYNSLCPSDGSGGNVPTGCVATAMAQIMKYWNYPPHGNGIHTYTDDKGSITGEHTVDFENTNYNWSAMDPAGPTSNPNDIATLMYHCGVSVEMDYEISGSSSCMFWGLFNGPCSSHTAREALRDEFGYNTPNGQARSVFIGNWINMLKEELDLRHPIMYSGATNLLNGPYHTWVCDGYDNSDLFHMNWGWGGNDDDLDGYYDLDDITPFGTDYDNWEGVLIDITPPGCVPSYEGEIPVVLGFPVSLETNDYILFTGGTIESGTVSYNAEYKIVLEPGCRIKEGVYANLYLEGCNAEPFQGEDEIEIRSTEISTTEVVEVNNDLIIAPNPFSYSTNFQYRLSGKHEVSIAVFNSAGTLVATVVDRQFQVPGEYIYTFEALDLTAGLYIVMLQKDGERITKRMVLTK